MVILRFYNKSNIKNYFKNIKQEFESERNIINERKDKKFLEIYKQASLSLSKIFQYVYHEYIKSSKKSSRLTSIVEMMINNNLREDNGFRGKVGLSITCRLLLNSMFC